MGREGGGEWKGRGGREEGRDEWGEGRDGQLMPLHGFQNKIASKIIPSN